MKCCLNCCVLGTHRTPHNLKHLQNSPLLPIAQLDTADEATRPAAPLAAASLAPSGAAHNLPPEVRLIALPDLEPGLQDQAPPGQVVRKEMRASSSGAVQVQTGGAALLPSERAPGAAAATPLQAGLLSTSPETGPSAPALGAGPSATSAAGRTVSGEQLPAAAVGLTAVPASGSCKPASGATTAPGVSPACGVQDLLGARASRPASTAPRPVVPVPATAAPAAVAALVSGGAAAASGGPTTATKAVASSLAHRNIFRGGASPMPPVSQTAAPGRPARASTNPSAVAKELGAQLQAASGPAAAPRKAVPAAKAVTGAAPKSKLAASGRPASASAPLVAAVPRGRASSAANPLLSTEEPDLPGRAAAAAPSAAASTPVPVADAQVTQPVSPAVHQVGECSVVTASEEPALAAAAASPAATAEDPGPPPKSKATDVPMEGAPPAAAPALPPPTGEAAEAAVSPEQGATGMHVDAPTVAAHDAAALAVASPVPADVPPAVAAPAVAAPAVAMARATPAPTVTVTAVAPASPVGGAVDPPAPLAMEEATPAMSEGGPPAATDVPDAAVVDARFAVQEDVNMLE